jgi:beta-lactamase class A
VKKYYFIPFVLCFNFMFCYSQISIDLTQKIEKHVKDKKAKVGIYIISDTGEHIANANPNVNFPMQSVFKVHIGLCMMDQIKKGKFRLDEKIQITVADLTPDIYSPLRDAYPDGTTLTIAEILEYTVSLSDNIGCDVLLKLLGGPATVENFIKKHGIEDISIKINEKTMQSNWDLQFLNWTTPKASFELLKMFYENKNDQLSSNHHQFFWDIMKNTKTGAKRIKGKLPNGTIVAHKTGWSGTNKEGITAAVNNIGIVFLPNGRYFYMCAFITDSSENMDTNENIIASIARDAYDYFLKLDK